MVQPPAQKTARVVAGFPGVGKSHFFREHDKSLKVLDSDSTEFSKLADKTTPNPAWPKNYIDHIQKNIDQVDIIFVSTHKDTRALLAQNNIPYTLVYPDARLKLEYMERYRVRQSPDFLINILDKNWDNFVAECEAQKDCKHVKLSEGQTITSVAKEWQSDEP